MKAMQLDAPRRPLVLRELPDPEPGPQQVRIRIEACGICRTDLHVCDGELRQQKSPLTPGHEIVGFVDRLGEEVSALALGARVGVGWLGSTCRTCAYCHAGSENLCDAPGFTGWSLDGGFATHAVADARYVYRLPPQGDAAALAPLMCAGLIGWRSLKFAGDAQTIGFYGFGAAAHIVLQVAKWEEKRCFAFTRPGDAATQAFARSLGADWAGGSDEAPPQQLDAAIIYAPVGSLVPTALRAVRKGGRVVCAGIHMSDIPAFPYDDLWGERSIVSVANLTRKDAEEFLSLAPRIGLRVQSQVYRLEDANQALDDLRGGGLRGAAVLRI